MVAKRTILDAKAREQSALKARRSGRIPGVLYGHGIKSLPVEVSEQAFRKAYQEAGSTSLVRLVIGKREEKPVLIREIQRHPVHGEIMHVDFYQVRMDEKIRAQVPLSFVGEAPAVKDLGGVLVRSLDKIDLEALPNDLPHDIEVDISGLDDFEKIIHISDLRLPKEVTLFHGSDDVVALVQPPRSEEELEELEEKVSEDVEGVEGVAEKEGEEGAVEEKKEGEEAEAPKAEEKKE